MNGSPTSQITNRAADVHPAARKRDMQPPAGEQDREPEVDIGQPAQGAVQLPGQPSPPDEDQVWDGPRGQTPPQNTRPKSSVGDKRQEEERDHPERDHVAGIDKRSRHVWMAPIGQMQPFR